MELSPQTPVQHEVVVNLHMHTTYSDGHGSHARIAQAAIRAGVDVVIVTDHNVLVNGPEDYYGEAPRRTLLLVGEEVHDQARKPQKNHLMVFGAGKEMATYAHDPQELINAVRQAGGLAFIAHPYDPEAPAVGEDDISWVDWQVQGYTGIELWNHLSEFKGLLKTRLHAIYYAFNPRRFAVGPYPQVLKKWDELLEAGRRVVAIGGSDAHELPVRLGPLKRTIFPYEFHFGCVNTHLVTSQPLRGVLEDDRQLVYQALRAGNAFVGYDLPASTRGFRFRAIGKDHSAIMGGDLPVKGGVTFQIRLPRPVECRLVRHGQVVKAWEGRDTCTYIATQPGAYRVEASIEFLGRKRGWIFSNPIYLR